MNFLNVVYGDFCRTFLSVNKLSIFTWCYCTYKLVQSYPNLFKLVLRKVSKNEENSIPSIKPLAPTEICYTTEEPLPLDQVLFFSNMDVSCNGNQLQPCCEDTYCSLKNLRQIFKTINYAEKELLLSCYNFSNKDIADCVLAAFNRHVDVRIIVDCDSSLRDGSLVNELRKKGVKIRMKPSSFIFHHKFFLIDEQILLHGSANFTDSSFVRNYDSCMILIDPILVKKFKDEFNYLWDSFTMHPCILNKRSISEL